MKKRNVALYDPYLDVMGGGEKHILSILQAIQDESQINVLWNNNLNKSIKNILNLDFQPEIKFIPNILNSSFIKKTFSLAQYDIFFYVTDGSYFFSPARRNFIFCMVPNKKLYSNDIINKLKTFNAKFISNSKFTKNCLSKWGIKSEVIYPYVDQDYVNFKINNDKKEKIILSVGRFFKHLHAKKHDVIINTFKEMKKKNEALKDFKLILAGGLKQEDRDYLNSLKVLIGNDTSISLKINIPHKELAELYKKSMIYWHFTGYGVDDQIHPELVEHLGITPLEAMATGCIVFCHNTGGPKELIKNGENGFLFNNLDELEDKTLEVIKNDNLKKKVQNSAKEFVKDNFSYSVFKERVKQVILA